VLIGIEGFGGSGKTTFATELRAALDSAYVVGLDDFIVKDKLANTPWDTGAFDHVRLQQQVLQPARTGGQARYQKLTWETGGLGEITIVSDVDFVIVEGISAYHPSIAPYYDYKIWVDTPIEVARERGRARDGSNENAQYWDLWAQYDLAYQERYHPETVADLVVSGV
jgi:uridine kinase